MTTMTKPKKSRTQRTTKPRPVAPQTVTPETPLLDQAVLSAVNNLEQTAAEIARQIDEAAFSPVQLSLTRGMAIARLRAAITPPIESLLLGLANTKHGFRTDRGPQRKDPAEQEPYPPKVVIDCAIAALLDGVSWTGNEFAILDGEHYITGEGWAAKLAKLSGFTDLVPRPGVPETIKGQLCVRYGASWRFNGVVQELRDVDGQGVPFPVEVTDECRRPAQLVGKAGAKALRMIYRMLTGSVQTSDACQCEADVAFVTDEQELLLNDAIEEAAASAVLIRRHYRVRHGERLLSRDFEECLKKIKAGEFSRAAQNS